MDEGSVTGVFKVSGVMTPRDVECGMPRQRVLRRMVAQVGEALFPVLSDPRPKQITYQGLEEKRVPAPVPDPSVVVQQDVKFTMRLLVVLTQLQDAEVGDLVSLDIYVEPGILPVPKEEITGRFEKTGHGWLRTE